MRGVVLIASLFLAGCSRPPVLAGADGVELTPIRTISRLEQSLRLARAGVRDVPVRYDIDAYRMIYRVRLADGREEIVSGLLALPRGARPQTLVVYNHGTTATRENVPSTLKVAGRAAMLTFAGAGYALIAPDYLGLGASRAHHPYLIADPQARTVVAMIQAARGVEGVPQGPVFLTGHSEGGHASLAAMRMIEASGERVLGAAPVAGAYDLRGVSLRDALHGEAPTDVLYLAYASWAYADHYGRPLDSILTPDRARSVEARFRDEAHEALPEHPRELFNADFLHAVDDNGSHWFLDALAQNTVSDWAPRAPVRFYYGSADTEVSPRESRSAVGRMQARGGDVQAVDLGPLEHDPSLNSAIPQILEWLQALEGER